MTNRVLCAAVLLAGAACSGDKDGWMVVVQVRGPEAAFGGRQIVMRAKVEKVAPSPGGAGAGLLGTTVGFSTCDHDRFLSAPIDIEVREGDATVSAVTLDRVACMFTSTPGYMERNYVYLEETGNLLATIDGSDPRVYASCDNAARGRSARPRSSGEVGSREAWRRSSRSPAAGRSTPPASSTCRPT